METILSRHARGNMDVIDEEEEHNLLEQRALLHLVGEGEVGESPRQPGRLEDREDRLELLRRKRTRAKVTRSAPLLSREPAVP